MKNLLLLIVMFTFVSIGSTSAQCPHAAKAAAAKTTTTKSCTKSKAGSPR